MKTGWGLLLLFLMSFTAQARERIVWILPDWPPIERSGVEPSQSIFQWMMKVIADEMPSYEHHFVVGNIDKAVRLWKENKNVCALPALVTPQRQQLAYFTALTLVPAYRFVVSSSKASSFQAEKGEVSIRRVLENKNIKGALIQERSYGIEFDRLFSEKKTESLTRVQPKEDWMAVLSMVRNGRVDYTLEFPEYLRYFNLKNPTGGPLVGLKMVEMSPTLPAFVACAKGEWGKKIIWKVDRILQKLSKNDAYKKELNLMFINEPTTTYKQDMKEFLEKRTAESWIY